MSLYEFLVPILLAVPALGGVLWLRHEGRKLDRLRELQRHHPAE